MHSCREWRAIGTRCPGGLLQSAAETEGGGAFDGPGHDEEIISDREKAIVPSDGFEIERQVLLELNRRMSRRAQTVDKLGAQKETSVKARPRVPVAIIEEAVRQGATGRQLSIWVAAAAAAGAVGLRFGPGAADQIPKVVRSVRNMAGVSQTFPRGGGPRVFNAARALELVLTQRRPFGSGRSGSGNFFPGILG